MKWFALMVMLVVPTLARAEDETGKCKEAQEAAKKAWAKFDAESDPEKKAAAKEKAIEASGLKGEACPKPPSPTRVIDPDRPPYEPPSPAPIRG